MDILSNNFPGTQLVKNGLKDLKAESETKYSMLLLSAKTRLKALGIDINENSSNADPALLLFKILQSEQGDGAHSMFNALNRELLSFIKAAEHETRS